MFVHPRTFNNRLNNDLEINIYVEFIQIYVLVLTSCRHIQIVCIVNLYVSNYLPIDLHTSYYLQSLKFGHVIVHLEVL